MLFFPTSRANWPTLQKAAMASAALHLSLSFWVWNDWSLQEQEKRAVTIPVEVVTVAPTGNIPKPKVEEQKKRKKVPPPAAEKKPPPPKADKKKKVTKKEKPKVKPMPTKKAEKGREKADAELQKVLSGILKNVEKVKPRPLKEKQQGTTIRNLPNSAKREENSRPLSLSQIEALQEHFARCWNVPAGAREGAKLKVKINVKISPMGDITSAAIAPDQDMDNPFARAAAESALRAVESPLCNKVDLPIEQYSLWKDMTLNFDPAMLLGG